MPECHGWYKNEHAPCETYYVGVTWGEVKLPLPLNCSDHRDKERVVYKCPRCEKIIYIHSGNWLDPFGNRYDANDQLIGKFEPPELITPEIEMENWNLFHPKEPSKRVSVLS